MRFFLALWVVAYHQLPALDDPSGWPNLQHAIYSVLRTGYAAVGVFFILSGFVLAYNYDLTALRMERNLMRFAVARFSRIYPAYLFGLLLLIPFGAYQWMIGVPGMGIGSLVLHLTLLQAWVAPVALTWNYPGWSLSDEAFFYAVLPFVGAWLWRLAKGRAAVRLVVAALILWALSLLVPIYATMAPILNFGDVPATEMELPPVGPIANFIRYTPLLRLPEFCLGVITAAAFYRLLSRRAGFWNRGTWLYLPAMVLTLAVLAGADRIPYPLLHNGLLDPLYMIMLLGLALGGGWIARCLSTRPLVFLGNASYSMYILHVPIYTWLKLLYRREFRSDSSGTGFFVMYVILVVGLSSVFFHFLEEPLHQWLKRKLWARIASKYSGATVS
jgi:peptidoglycan/LPS O-acetylase OafA/YrhL